MKKLTFVFLVSGSGEFAQAASVAKKLRSHFYQILLLIDSRLKEIAKTENLYCEIVNNYREVYKILEGLPNNILVLCNSKTVNNGLINYNVRPPSLFIASLDSNWIFDRYIGKNRVQKVPKWLDRFYALFPEKIYLLNLSKNGGLYHLPDNFKNKVLNVGFIPSDFNISIKYQSAVFKDYQNFLKILIYFGVSTDIIFPKIIQKIDNAVTNINKQKNKQIKIFAVRIKNEHKIKSANIVYIDQFLKEQELLAILKDADLIIQHHGIGTLAKIMKIGKPVICLTPDTPNNIHKYLKGKAKYFNLNNDYPDYYTSKISEIKPFVDLGLCRNFSYNCLDQNILTKTIENLLSNKKSIDMMIKKQKNNFKSGEEVLINDILKIAKKYER